MCTNTDLKISLHVCVRKIAIILWKFHILNEFFSYLLPKFCLSLKSRQHFIFFIFIHKNFKCAYLKKRGWTFCSLLVTFCSLLVTFYLLLVAYCEIKLLWTANKWFGYYETPPQIFFLQISEIFVTFSGWWFSKFSQHAKPFSKLA